MRFESPQASFARGVDLVTMEMNWPDEIAAPQAPQYPQVPPGSFLPLEKPSLSASSRSMSPPAFLYAVSSAQFTNTWCSGPCMWQHSRFIRSFMMVKGFAESWARRTVNSWLMPCVWHSSQT